MLLTINLTNMLASINYNIIGASAPFTFSVKDEEDVERFSYIESGKIWFTATKNGKYSITISKGTCHIKNEMFINDCGTTPVTPVTPTTPTTPTTPVVVCSVPSLGLISVSQLTGTFSITSSTNFSCTSYELQYSLNDTFIQYTSKFVNCITSATIVFPSENIYFVRAIKYCGTTKVTSNIVSANLNSTNCFTSASCLGIGSDPDYDTYRIALSNPASEDVQFTLSNGSTVIIKKGDSSAEDIINISQSCPYIVSNNLNLKYCGTLTPVSPVTPVTPVSTCVKVYAINNSSLTDVITFTLCNGAKQSFTLAPFNSSPEVCVVNPNAWTSNIGEISIYNHGTC